MGGTGAPVEGPCDHGAVVDYSELVEVPGASHAGRGLFPLQAGATSFPNHYPEDIVLILLRNI